MFPKKTELHFWAILLASVFLLSGMLKMGEIDTFHAYVYRIIGSWVDWETTGLLAKWWCWLEILGGLSLLVPLKEIRLTGAIMVAGMLVFGTIFLFVAHGLGIETCLCFGSFTPDAMNYFSLNLLRNLLFFSINIRIIVLWQTCK